MVQRNCLSSAVGFLLLAAFLFFMCGCGKHPPKPVSVSGKLVRDGKGLEGMRVVFWPREPNLQRVETATGTGGEFSLECPPGGYLVTVNPASGSGPPIPDSGMPTTLRSNQSNRSNRTEKASSLASRYQDRQTTPLKVEVPAEGKKDVILAIEK